MPLNGFTEAAGNFQNTNYSGQGLDGDALQLDIQDAFRGNNATISVHADGQAPRMQLGLYTQPATVVSNTPGIASPTSVGVASFGPATYRVTGTLVRATPALATSPITNDVAGKIVVIDRGSATFVVKVKFAQDAGAIGVLIVNSVAGPATSLGGADPAITIPAVMVSRSEGAALVAALANGNAIRMTLDRPPSRDIAFDNSLMFQVYGTGVARRLSGPASGNNLAAVQSAGMAQGWGDFFSLMFTQRAGDQPGAGRAIAAYSFGTAAGVRRQLYSFDMAVNPVTFASYNADANHLASNTAEAWASSLWDLNWLLIQKYGYDSNLATGYTGVGDGAAGNKLALQLVTDALQLQSANPSFTEARDAILRADLLRTGGENQREIWTAFARRGLGFGAATADATATSVATSFVIPSNLPRSTSSAMLATTAGGTVDITFSRTMDPASFSLAAGIIQFTGPDGTDRRSDVASFTWTDNNLALRLTLAANASPGTYTLVLAPTVKDAHGRSLDQDGNGTGGEAPADRASFAVNVFTPLVVTTANDELDTMYDPADLSLREAIVLANAHTGADTITFAPSVAGQTITLTLGELAFTDTTGATTVSGSADSPVTVSGNDASRVFKVMAGAAATLSDLVATRGMANSGAAIANYGSLTLVRSTVSRSNAPDDGSAFFNYGDAVVLDSTIRNNQGGGIINSGIMSIRGSTINANAAAVNSGGVFNGGSLVLSNSTISGNTANGAGGGIFNAGALTATNVTITANHARNNDAGTASGGGVWNNTGATTVLRNTLVAGNFVGSGTATPNDFDGAAIATSSNSLFGTTSAASGIVDGTNGNLVGVVNLLLSPLQDCGGPTLTHLPLLGSPLLDHGSAAFGTADDQRGIVRDSTPDIGAVEAVYRPNFADVTINEDGSFSLPFSFGDYDLLNPATALSSNPLLIQNSDLSVFTSLQGGIVTGAPDANLSGSATISLVQTINGALHTIGSFHLTVQPVNDSPTLTAFNPVLASITEDESASLGQTVASVVADSLADIDSAAPGIAVNGATTGGHGRWEYQLNGSPAWLAFGAVTASSALLLRPADRVRFVPDGITGTTATFAYVAWDQSGTTAGGQRTRVNATVRGDATPFSTTSDSASLAVTPINDAPIARNGTKTMKEDGAAITIDLRTLASDAETAAAGLEYVVAPISAKIGTLTATATRGVYFFRPAANFNGTVPLRYTVTDTGDMGTPTRSSTATFSVVVTAVNDAPIAKSGARAMKQNGAPITIDLRSLVSDVETAKTGLVFQVPVLSAKQGTLKATATRGVYTFRPAANFTGKLVFRYRVTDAGSPMLTSSALFTINVNRVG